MHLSPTQFVEHWFCVLHVPLDSVNIKLSYVHYLRQNQDGPGIEQRSAHEDVVKFQNIAKNSQVLNNSHQLESIVSTIAASDHTAGAASKLESRRVEHENYSGKLSFFMLIKYL